MQTNIPQSIVDEAIAWVVKLQAGDAEPTTIEACLRWRHADQRHEQAWQQLQAIHQQIGGLPKNLTREVLRPPQQSRRTVVKSLMLLAGAGTFGSAAYRYAPWQQWVADHGTAVGEQRNVLLEDGTSIMLNTDTAIQLAFNHHQRLIHLLDGEIFVTSAHDTQTPDRPLSVQTAHGNILALGTQFIVHRQSSITQVTVLQSAVKVQLQTGASQRINAGEVLQFNADALFQLQTANPDDTAWIDGLLVANNMQLVEFVRRLDRYFKGKIHCDNSAAELKISGVFSIHDISHTLKILQETLPIVAVARTPYWITLQKRAG